MEHGKMNLSKEALKFYRGVRKESNRAHAQTRKARKGRRRKGIMWDYNLDGRTFEERIKGAWKKYWKRYWRRESKKEIEKYNK